MSADSYAICPYCNPDQSPNPTTGEWEHTLREDWEIGFDGNLPGDTSCIIDYRAKCSECGATATMTTYVELKQ